MGNIVSAPRFDWIAPEGQLWVCQSCGKLATYREGYRPGMPCSPGWNQNCFDDAKLEVIHPVIDADIFQ